MMARPWTASGALPSAERATIPWHCTNVVLLARQAQLLVRQWCKDLAWWEQVWWSPWWLVW